MGSLSAQQVDDPLVGIARRCDNGRPRTV